MQALARTLAAVHADWGVSGLRLLGEGLENRVFRANTRAFGPAVRNFSAGDADRPNA